MWSTHHDPRDGANVLCFSAHVLDMPPLCCCCARPTADATYTAYHTRWSGRKVIRSNTKYWNFPICFPCRAWVEAVDEVPTLGSLGVILRIAVWSAVTSIGSLLFFFGCWGAAAHWLALAISVMAAGASMCCFAFYFMEKKRLNGERDKAWNAAMSIRPLPSCPPLPVEYLGWQGSLRKFRFGNPAFAHAFASANHRKQVH